jgi:hypothetical protein
LRLEVNVTEAQDDQHHEDPDSTAGSAEDERINDPLTRTAADAPRPFGSQQSSSQQQGVRSSELTGGVAISEALVETANSRTPVAPGL